MRKTCIFAYAKTKAQISCAVERAADQHLCFSHIDSTIPFLPKPLSFVVVQPGLCQVFSPSGSTKAQWEVAEMNIKLLPTC